MDALARLEPVARPLLRQVDNALATLGAPVEHPVWGYLRRLGTTPADAVAFFADVQPARLRTTAGQLREQAAGYEAVSVPARLPWQGAAGELYASQAAGLDAHLRGEAGMAARLRATASYVDAVADWHQDARDRVARVLAEVLTSTEAVTLRSYPALGHGLTELMHIEAMHEAGATGAGGGLRRAVLAAADVAVAVLTVAEDAAASGRDLHHMWDPSLAEITYRAPVFAEPLPSEGTIRLHH
jgi:hypothetical protein